MIALTERGLVTNSTWRLKAIEVNRENTISSRSSSENFILRPQNHRQNHRVSLFEQRGAPSRLLSVRKAITNNSLYVFTGKCISRNL